MNAVATLTKVAMPALFPSCAKFCEVGSYFIDGDVIPRLMEVSPDGVIRYLNFVIAFSKFHFCTAAVIFCANECTVQISSCEFSRENCVCGNKWPLLIDRVAVEIKCIYLSDNHPPVCFSCPPYYVMQVLAEMVI